MKNTHRYYCGVGSRKTPNKILEIMTKIAEKMSIMGLILRSGGAEGADTAFEKGSSKSCIYYASDATIESMQLAEKFHPAWKDMSTYAKKLHGRNSFQVLGRNMSEPSECLICWTPDKCIRHSDRSISTGGTGTAISIADNYSVPIFNLKRDDHLWRILNWLEN